MRSRSWNRATCSKSFLLLGLLCASAPAQEQKPVDSAPVPTNGVPTVAVLPFDNLSTRKHEVLNAGRAEGRDRSVIDRYAEVCRVELEHQLVNLKGVGVVDRDRITRALDELKFSSSGLVDPRTALRLGRLLRADYILTGSLTEVLRQETSTKAYGIAVRRVTMQVSLRVKLLDVETGQVEFSREMKGEALESSHNAQQVQTEPGDPEWSLFLRAVENAREQAQKQQVFRKFFGKLSEDPPVTLRFEPHPEGCDLEINGQLEGTTPCNFTAAAGLRITVRLSRAGYKPWEKTLAVAARHGKTPFSPRLGKLKLSDGD